MKISQPKLIFSTRRNTDTDTNIDTATPTKEKKIGSLVPLTPTSTSTNGDNKQRTSLLQKTKSFITNHQSYTPSQPKTSPVGSTLPLQENEKIDDVSLVTKKGEKAKAKAEPNSNSNSSSNSKRKSKDLSPTFDSDLNENKVRRQESSLRPTASSQDQPQNPLQPQNQSQTQTKRQTLNDGLAICLFGYSVQAQTHQIETKLNASSPSPPSSSNTIPASVLESESTLGADTNRSEEDQEIQSNTRSKTPKDLLDMYDSTYEEEIRQQAVMAEVLPDAEMWAKWEKTEAPLRQGRGWYPRLDRHFLELLVISEIHALSHPTATSPPSTADRIHRHASRVRRVACERIGAERLNAYCERVKEAFEAYMMGGWTHQQQSQIHAQSQSEIASQIKTETEDDGENDEVVLRDSVNEDLRRIDGDLDIGDDGGDDKSMSEGEGEGEREERGRTMIKGKKSEMQKPNRKFRTKSKSPSPSSSSSLSSMTNVGSGTELKVPRINIIPSQESDTDSDPDFDFDANNEDEMDEVPLNEITEELSSRSSRAASQKNDAVGSNVATQGTGTYSSSISSSGGHDIEMDIDGSAGSASGGGGNLEGPKYSAIVRRPESGARPRINLPGIDNLRDS
ncbi:uncharacterized protein I303_105895 [Kwoniella dejecticola CBS 10117]|uniref:Uncharacterized protein n=1 Tax=Kwoniella dejecticola CBS 10117 TaxID=1296121 RepID=A0A1A6A0P7_9TREE|nr:uncharacterized protein I303_05917 [Kwoniella dejecticola CBS 10117]OBR83637.1 hypothetical protein I303_05917 [Kwoniella dejecticola CBS 10117]